MPSDLETPPTKARADSPEVRKLVEGAVDLVKIIAVQMRRQLGSSLDVDDLISLGHEGLLGAARSFDASRGIPFRGYANLRVRGSMIDGLRTHGGLPRRVYRHLKAMEAGDRVQDAQIEEDGVNPPATPQDADAKLSTRLSGIAMAMAAGFISPEVEGMERVPDLAASPEEQATRNELVDRVRAAIASRPDAERKLLERHYFDGLTFEDAAQEIGLSKSWASRLHARAIEAVAEDLKRRNVEP